MPRTIHWRYADDGTGQPGPAVPATGSDTEIVVTNIIPDTPIEINYSADPSTGVWVNQRTLIHTLPADRVPLIEVIPGNRPRVTPAQYYYDAADELRNPLAHPMVMGTTHTAVKDGLWSDPTVWNTGTVPGAQAIVNCGNFHVQYDQYSDVIRKAITIGIKGKWSWKPGMDTRLRVSYRMCMGITELNDPTESETLGKPRHEVIYHPDPAGPPGASALLGDMPMGPSNYRGAYKTEMLRAKWLNGQALPSIPANATSFTVDDIPALQSANWRIGDELVIGGTEYLLPATSDPTYVGPSTYYNPRIGVGNVQRQMNEFQFGQDEAVTITGINPTTGVVSFTPALQFAHTGMTGTLPDGPVITVLPFVAHLTRSILFRGASAQLDSAVDPAADLTNLQKRAHWMAMFADVDVRHVRFMDMGRSDTNPTLTVSGLPYTAPRAGGAVTINPLLSALGGTPLADPDNVPGKWAMHIHKCPGTSFVQGVVVDGKNYRMPGWAMTHHGGKVLVEHCVAFNGRGAGIVSEDGSETGQWAHNVVMGFCGDGDIDGWGSRMEYYAKHNGSQGVAYENQSRSVLLHDNIAGSCKHGYMWHTQKDKYNERSPNPTDMRLVTGMSSSIGFDNNYFQSDAFGQLNAQIPPFKNNEAWACRDGMTVIHRQGDGRKKDKTPMLFNDFNCINVPFPFAVDQYSNSYYIRDSLWQGPLNMMTSSKAMMLGNVTWDWNFGNMLVRNYQTMGVDTGAGLNYEGHFIDIATENVTQLFSSSHRAVRGDHGSRDVMGPWVVHPDDVAKLETDSSKRWRIRPYEIESSANLPVPYPLEPYGRKLPAGHPPVPVGGTPYAVLGDGTNGESSSGINLSLTGNGSRGQGGVYWIVRDCVGDRRYPDFQSSETYPANLSIVGARSLERLQPEQLVQRNGCWQDAGVWKCRTWEFGADRFTHVRFTFSVDWTLASGFHPDFLAAHDIGGPSVSPVWPDELEAIPKAQIPLFRKTKSLKFLSRTRLEVVSGQALTHRLYCNEPVVIRSIAGGADAALFQIANQELQWTAAGTRLNDSSDANADNTYEVTLRIEDRWGNQRDEPHQVVVVPSARVSSEIIDNFNRVNEALDANPAYVTWQGAAGGFTIVSDALRTATTTSNTHVDLGSLGTSNMELVWNFTDWNTAYLTFRGVDADNWIGIRRRDEITPSAVYMHMRIAGVTSTLGRFTNQGGNQWRIRMIDRRLEVFHNGHASLEPKVRYPLDWGQLTPLELDEHTGAGVVLLPANAPMGTHVGVRSGNVARGFIDNLTARALPS